MNGCKASSSIIHLHIWLIEHVQIQLSNLKLYLLYFSYLGHTLELLYGVY